MEGGPFVLPRLTLLWSFIPNRLDWICRTSALKCDLVVCLPTWILATWGMFGSLKFDMKVG
ncbi:hypothetical protein M6B38_286940 [Iris pallida]|uniref:Uncharacterized protein n=1 Tax=Iris pallida TaxID=29817 RepID=A0AAX6HY10_IRIPA|nr:hypothetical protein M6B38_286940 [Iris pallida]